MVCSFCDLSIHLFIDMSIDLSVFFLSHFPTYKENIPRRNQARARVRDIDIPHLHFSYHQTTAQHPSFYVTQSFQKSFIKEYALDNIGILHLIYGSLCKTLEDLRTPAPDSKHRNRAARDEVISTPPARARA